MSTPTLTPPATSEDLIGKTFVLGAPNAKDEYIIMLAGTRWLIANTQGIPAGERVKVTSFQEQVLQVSRA